MFVALIAPVGMAKTVVLDAADKNIFLPEPTKVYTTPASDRGLVKLLGEDGNTVMLIEDEFHSVLSKCQVPNSNLAQVICKLWSKDKGGVADKKGVDHEILARGSLLFNRANTSLDSCASCWLSLVVFLKS